MLSDLLRTARQPAAGLLTLIVACCIASTTNGQDAFQRVRVVEPSGIYVDRAEPLAFDPTSLLLGGGSKTKSFYKLANAIDDFAADGSFDVVAFDLSAPVLAINSAHFDELSRRMAGLRASGKRTIAWVENASLPHLLFASMCDEVVAADFGVIDCPSVALSTMFYGDLFDLLGVETSVVRVGKFKGAVEPYTRSTMSKNLRSHYEALAGSLNDARCEMLASRRKMSVGDVRALQRLRIFTAQAALDAGLIDATSPHGTMREAIAERLGWSVDTIKWLEKTTKKKKPPSIFELFAEIMGSQAKDDLKSPGLAVLHISGTIIDGDKAQPGSAVSGPLVRAIDDVRTDKDVLGVVLRIDSPGGSATASDAIRNALLELVAAKPVVVSMGPVAASGGYWVSALGVKVYAEPQTITGSIGVFALKMSFGTMMRRLGVHIESIALDESATATGIDRGWTEFEKQRIGNFTKDCYDRFLDIVSKSRGMSREAVDNIGGGRVWSGRQAHAIGLVDELGGLDNALAMLREKTGLDADAPVVDRPKAVDNPFDLLGLFEETEGDVKALSALRLLSKAGFDLRGLMGMLSTSLDPNASPVQVWALWPEELLVR